jgi:hypothetical protein
MGLEAHSRAVSEANPRYDALLIRSPEGAMARLGSPSPLRGSLFMGLAFRGFAALTARLCADGPFGA